MRQCWRTPTLGVGLVVVVSCCTTGCLRTGYSPEPPAPPGPVVFAGGPMLPIGSVGTDVALAITTTSQGHLLVAGSFRGTVSFGCPLPIAAAGGADGYLVELTPELTCVRVWTIGGAADDAVITMAEDATGNILVAGEFRETATSTSGVTLTAQYLRDIFLTKLGSDGSHVWTRQIPGNSADQTYDLVNRVATDSIGTVYVFARVWGTVTYGWDGPTQTFTDNGWGDALLLRVFADGSYGGANTFGGGGSELTYGLAIDGADNVYLAGAYRGGGVDFDPGPASLVHSGNFDGFVERRKPDGSIDWLNVEENGGWRPYQGIVLQPGGALLAVQNDLFNLSPSIAIKTLAFDRVSGNVVWSQQVVAESMYAIAVTDDTAGNVYVAGRYGNTVDFDPGAGDDSRTSVGGQDCFVQSYDAAGNYRWTVTFGGTGDDVVNGVAALAPDDLVLVGTFEDQVDFGTDGTPDVQLSQGGTDIFVHRITRTSH